MIQKTSDRVVLTVQGTVSDSLKKAILKNEITNHPDHEPRGYYWVDNHLRYKGGVKVKKERKSTKRETTLPIEVNFLKDVVSRYNNNFSQEYIEDYGKNVEWRPLIITNPDNNEDLEMFKKNFLISKDGMIAQMNFDKEDSFTLKEPYWHSYGFSISLAIQGCDRIHRNQTIKNLVRNAWGDDASAMIEAEEDYIKTHEELYKKAV